MRNTEFYCTFADFVREMQSIGSVTDEQYIQMMTAPDDEISLDAVDDDTFNEVHNEIREMIMREGC